VAVSDSQSETAHAVDCGNGVAALESRGRAMIVPTATG
jgi:hypothetical protein